MTFSPLRLAAAACALACALPLQAQASRVWNLGSFSSATPAPAGGCTFVGGASAVGNSANCRANGSTATSMTVRAFSLTGNTGASTVVAGGVRSHGTSGLGVCFTNETCSSPDHAVDNIGQVDFLVFDFFAPARLEALSIGWVGADSDIQVLRWTGSGDPFATPLVGKSAAQLTATNNWSVFSSIFDAGTGAETLGNANSFSRYWIVAAYNPAFDNKGWTTGNDAFKLASVTATVVPEPSTYALLATGLAGLAAFRRRRARA
jgi:hypothetical protein